MGVCRDAGYTFYPEVVRSQWVTSLGHEHNEKTSQTGIHMQGEAVAQRQLEHSEGKY